MTTQWRPGKLIAAARKAKKRNLIRGAAIVRRRARSSLRKRKRVSRPGEKPSIHASKRNLRLILFAYDQQTQTSVVGPVKFQTSSSNVVTALEKGGRTAAKRRGRGGKRRRERRTIRPRPYMRPARDDARDAIGSLWKDSIVA